MPGTILGSRATQVKRTDGNSEPHRAMFCMQSQNLNKKHQHDEVLWGKKRARQADGPSWDRVGCSGWATEAV